MAEKLNTGVVASLLSIFVMIATPVTFLYLHKLDKTEFKEYRLEAKQDLKEMKKEQRSMHDDIIIIKQHIIKKVQ